MRSSIDRGGRSSQKSLQLCAQVKDALSFALGETRDPVLLDLRIGFVEPLGGDRLLLVGVVDGGSSGLVRVLGALDRARGYLRSCVAEQVHRGKAPQLSFTVIPEEVCDE